MLENSYLHEFCAQVSKIVFLGDLTVSRLITTVKAKMSRKLISPPVLVTNITNRVLSWFDRFVAYYNCMSEKVTKLISPWVLCTNIRKRVLSCFDRFTPFFYCMGENFTKLISPRVLCKKVTNRVLSWFDRFCGLLQLYPQNGQIS